MPIVVQKFGGSSVADVAKIRKVAERVARRRAEGFQLVIVVSAMGDTTDELLTLAKQISADPPRRELDMLLTCGERISMALLSMALHELEVPAISFTGSQSGIITTDTHSQARILEVKPQRIESALGEGKVVIVAGYQGVSRQREVTTLGRGGSDTTAVALAAALNAEACEIYSDVDGVFSADPRVVPDARKLESLSHDEMQELAHAGARVLNAQAVEFAKEKGIVIHARTTHGEGAGSRITPSLDEHRGRVKAVASDANVGVLCCAATVPLHDVVEVLSARGVALRCSSAWPEEGGTLAVIPLENVHGVKTLRRALVERFGAAVSLREDLGTVTLVGAGIGTDATLLQKVIALAKVEAADLRALHAGPLQITLMAEKVRVASLSRVLHNAFIPG